MAIYPQRLTIYLYSAHRAVIFAIAQLSCSSTYRRYISFKSSHATHRRPSYWWITFSPLAYVQTTCIQALSVVLSQLKLTQLFSPR